MDTSRLVIKNDKVKHSGQVFTPDYLVNEILDCAGYVGQSVLCKHVIDNSCGDGAFLCALLERYSTAFLSVNDDKSLLKKELETYIHGIEIDEEAYLCCIENLDFVASSFGLTGVKWDVLNSDALLEHGYDGKMDFVVGNPPYVRVHNLNDSYDDVKSHQFANGGMTDLYLVFFEIGLDMLKNGGCLCYITPSSWINSLAGTNMRAYIQRTHCMNELIDLGHFQPFKATTYTMIAKMVKGIVFDSIDYYSYDGAKQAKVFVEKLGYDDVFIQSNLVLGSLSAVKEYADVVRNNYNSLVKVKNGFATLADKVFISDDFPFEDYVIDVIKASTGKWRKAFFPYNKNGKPYSKQEIFSNAELSDYLAGNKKDLLKGRTEAQSPEWYLYGRTQALKDVFVDKYSINTVIRDVDSVKIHVVKSGQGLYSGLYIIGNVTYEALCKILKSERFIRYVKLLKKYKSGGYYTFNSKDLEIYLNYNLGLALKNKEKTIKVYDKQRFSECSLQFI